MNPPSRSAEFRNHIGPNRSHHNGSRTRQWAASLGRVGIHLTLWSALAGTAGISVAGPRATGVVAPIFTGAQNQPSAVVRAASISSGYQRHGFFRIGLLPLVVASGVTVDLADIETAGPAFLKVADCLRNARSGAALELHDVTLRLPPLSGSRLRAGRVEIQRNAQWKLSEEVKFWQGTNLFEANVGFLQVAGPKAGELRLQSGTTNIILRLFPSRQP